MHRAYVGVDSRANSYKSINGENYERCGVVEDGQMIQMMFLDGETDIPWRELVAMYREERARWEYDRWRSVSRLYLGGSKEGQWIKCKETSDTDYDDDGVVYRLFKHKYKSKTIELMVRIDVDFTQERFYGAITKYGECSLEEAKWVERICLRGPLDGMLVECPDWLFVMYRGIKYELTQVTDFYQTSIEFEAMVPVSVLDSEEYTKLVGELRTLYNKKKLVSPMRIMERDMRAPVEPIIRKRRRKLEL